jgi:hypothetical protein
VGTFYHDGPASVRELYAIDGLEAELRLRHKVKVDKLELDPRFYLSGFAKNECGLFRPHFTR